MNAIFRHMAVRLWATAMAGGVLCLLLLPQWQSVFGMQWMALPSIIVLVACFSALGWLMNRWGAAVIRRQVAEAAVWERAGMVAEAEKAFELAKELYDSFWLSPMYRRQLAGWITMRLARFYLARPMHGREGQSMVAAYLHLQPGDEAVAVGWLESALSREDHTSEDHEVAGRIHIALVDNDTVQRLLMQFYLVNMRCDFEAIQTYRRMWQQESRIPRSQVCRLARVLLNDAYVADWALQVYLKAYSFGEVDCLAAIAAGRQLLYPNEQNRQYLAFADEVMKQFDHDELQRLAQPFMPADNKRKRRGREKPLALPQRIEAVLEWIGRCVQAVVNAVERGMAAGRSRDNLPREIRLSVPRIVVTVILLAVAGLVSMAGWQVLNHPAPVPAQAPAAAHVPAHAVAQAPVQAPAQVPALHQVPPPIEVVKPIEPPPVADPLTIQVAAYMKLEDAQQVVDQFKQEQLDAFWTQAASADRTWYQVKISHFSNKADAQKYGEMLKSKGIIDDFYVTNYGK